MRCTVLAVAIACASCATAARWRFDGKDLGGFRSPHSEWRILDGGIMAIEGKVKGGNLLTSFEHGDVEAHIEFMVPKGSNSGLYFQGRYEIQILDSWGVEKPGSGDCGGIYQRWADGRGFEGHAPRVNASRPAGEWQTFDIQFRAPRFDSTGKKVENARFVRVVLNGQTLHENVEVTGPTRSAAFDDERPAGPFMLQGDHGSVAYRNIVLESVRRD